MVEIEIEHWHMSITFQIIAKRMWKQYSYKYGQLLQKGNYTHACKSVRIRMNDKETVFKWGSNYF